tara:strand:+ start:1308 stop:1508 length:201 start_codon:yes stop_codon:yes gene_type:complete
MVTKEEKKKYRVERFNGRTRNQWYWRVVAKNGQTLLVSESYTRKDSRNRIANRFGKLCGIQVIDSE